MKSKSISTNGFGRMHSQTTEIKSKDATIHVLSALQDNFMYLIVDPKTNEAAVVDPVDANVIDSVVKEHNVNLTKILTTHHHWDHAGGNQNMCRKFKNLNVYGGDDRIEAINCRVKHGDIINVGELKVECLETPCHTTSHICYYVTGPEKDTPSVFTGDTLFIGGCGRFFEGTPEQMHKALNKVLGSLPGETRVFCGHEYTCANLKYGLAVEPNNEAIQKKLEWAIKERETQTPTVPSSIAEEKLTNPFMRVNEASVMEHAQTTDPIETMRSLRKEKDSFKA
ncbi:hydroxyacylglutathione hydrolase, mitochondrial isoform X2 [Venturia canescens]|uniref:hydroxyacylglutathione hydrolase, mitochondrial isoform X2 n=1 Tax=Venturia canescens TaxID=32260 RepID=UPI001C9BC7FA|nr:hydroxyacylglutathione hydrolase, mitochondrial isoform X2 [Venturia canescens]